MTETEFEFILIGPEDFPPSWSRFLEIVFVLQGSGVLQMEEGQSPYDIHEGDIFAVNSFRVRSVTLDRGSLAIALRVSPSFLAVLSPETENIRVNCKSFLLGPDRQEPFDALRRDFALAFRAYYKKESPLPIHLRSRIAALLDDLLRDFSKSGGDAAAESGRERLRGALNYLCRHFRENVGLADIASRCGLSAPYLSRSFRRHLGVSFTEYLAGLRLMHATALLRGGGSVTDIALESGFSGAGALIGAFRRYRGTTPGKYREDAGKRREGEAEDPPRDRGFFTAFASLLKYTGGADRAEEAGIRQSPEIREIAVNTASPLSGLSHTWKRLVNAGYARDILNGSLQRQLRRLQRRIGFEYIRCKGLLDDDMMILEGNDLSAANFVYVDEAVDFILSCGAKPFLEFSHVPSALAKQRVQLFRRPAILSVPAELGDWQRFLGLLMDHLAERYGREELTGWIFSPWTALAYSAMDFFSMEEYAEVYAASFRVIKERCAELRVAGPGSSIQAKDVLARFLEICGEKNCLPDILSLHSFAAVQPEEEKSGLELMENSEAFSFAVSGDEAYLAHTLQDIETTAGGIPILLDEWSNTIWQRDLCNDTCYKSAWIFKSILENYDSCYGMGYFSAGDQLDEVAPAPELFHGGFGLFARNGLPKSAFRALELLAGAGNTLLSRGEGWFVTASEGEIQIFLYNYCHYDALYRYRHTANISGTERYRVFNEKPPRQYHISLEGLSPGAHRVRRYSIGRTGGSVYDAWLAMGAPEAPDREEEKLLRALSRPVYRNEIVHCAGILGLGAWLPPHEVQLITVSRGAVSKLQL
ncbi:MAG: helix-turn-helix domain-containing protein [Treponema sp.]|jgi:xylan 1,4-beta-xylosidase|nr:helix-turn-helix domain-containing protein [Treponema sp.]